MRRRVAALVVIAMTFLARDSSAPAVRNIVLRNSFNDGTAASFNPAGRPRSLRSLPHGRGGRRLPAHLAARSRAVARERRRSTGNVALRLVEREKVTTGRLPTETVREDRVVASLIYRAGGPDDPLKRPFRFLFVGPREGEGGGS